MKFVIQGRQLEHMATFLDVNLEKPGFISVVTLSFSE